MKQPDTQLVSGEQKLIPLAAYRPPCSALQMPAQMVAQNINLGRYHRVKWKAVSEQNG